MAAGPQISEIGERLEFDFIPFQLKQKSRNARGRLFPRARLHLYPPKFFPRRLSSNYLSAFFRKSTAQPASSIVAKGKRCMVRTFVAAPSTFASSLPLNGESPQHPSARSFFHIRHRAIGPGCFEAEDNSELVINPQ